MAFKGNSKGPALSVLRMLAKMISTMSQEEFDALASGKARLTVTYLSERQSEMPVGRSKSGVLDIGDLQKRLGSAESTAAALSIIAEASLTRAEVERMARSIDVPVTKQDTVGRLEEKIVESLVGARLNSRAIRGR